MKILELLEAIKKMDVSIFTTQDVASSMNTSGSSASRALRKLEEANLVIKVKNGLWAFPDRLDPLLLPKYLLAPYPVYVSFQSALYYRNVIDQIPTVLYVATLRKSKRYETPIATISAHQIQPDFFFGYTYDEQSGVQMASAEKALVDILYLYPSKSLIFRSLPEIDREEVNWDLAREIVEQIPTVQRRTIARKRLTSLQ